MPSIEQLHKMLQAEPKDAFLRYALAMELAKQNQTADSLKEFEMLLIQHPDYVAGYFMKGRTLAQSGDIESAATTYRKGIDVAKEKGDLHAAGEMSDALEELAG